MTNRIVISQRAIAAVGGSYGCPKQDAKATYLRSRLDLFENNGIFSRLGIHMTRVSWRVALFFTPCLSKSPSEFSQPAGPREHQNNYDSQGRIDKMTSNRFRVLASLFILLVFTSTSQAQPDVFSTIPLANTIDNAATTNIKVTFTEPILASSLDHMSFSVYGSMTGNSISSVTYDSFTKTATYDPLWDFLPGEVVTVILNQDIVSPSNGPLVTPHVFEFIIGVTPSSAIFDSMRTFPAGDFPVTVEFADFDGDGLLDMVASNRNSNDASIYGGNGGGDFYLFFNEATGMWPLGICVADVYRTLDPGFITANFTDDSLSVMENTGALLFLHHKREISGNSQFVSTGDLNGDGFLDVVSTTFDSLNIMMHSGLFGLDPYVAFGTAGTMIADIKLADINNDGDHDLLLTHNGGGPGTGDLSVFRNDGTGTLLTPPDIYPLTGGPIAVLAGDLNGDAWLDVVVACRIDSTVKVFINNGVDGLLNAPVTYPVGFMPLWVVAADLDGDMHLDLAVANEDGTSIALLMNNGPGTFGSAQMVPIGYSTGWISYGDIDGDGDIDLAVPLPYQDSVMVLFNKTAISYYCGQFSGGYTGNTNCDENGKRNLADITRLIDRVYISKLDLCDEAEGNTNGDVDSKINLADITILIDHVYISKAETSACE